MARSTKDAWLSGPGDLREADVDDVPTPGMSVKVRGLSAKYSAEVMGQMRLTTEGVEQVQVAKVDVAAMERLQFRYGVIDPQFNQAEVALLQERWGPAFKKVVAKIDELSGIDKDAIEAAETRFPAGGTPPVGPDPGNGVATGDPGPDLPVRTGA